MDNIDEFAAIEQAYQASLNEEGNAAEANAEAENAIPNTVENSYRQGAFAFVGFLVRNNYTDSLAIGRAVWDALAQEEISLNDSEIREFIADEVEAITADEEIEEEGLDEFIAEITTRYGVSRVRAAALYDHYMDGEFDMDDGEIIRDLLSDQVDEGSASAQPYPPASIYTQKLHEMAVEIFGEENVSLDRFGIHRHSNGWKVVIKIDDFTIRNRDGRTHFIRGLYIIFIEASDGSIDRGMHGFRSQLTEQELMSGYAHSHLPGTSIGNFCQGSDMMAVMTNDLQNASRPNSNMESFVEQADMVLMYLENFLAYESLEGTPHRRMENIGSRGRTYINYQEINRLVESTSRMLRSWLRESPEKLRYSIDLPEMQASLIVTPEMDAKMADICPSQHRMLMDTISGELYNPNQDGRVPSTSNDTIEFKGNTVGQSVVRLSDNSENEEDRVWYTHSQVRDKIIGKLNTLLSQKLKNKVIELINEQHDENNRQEGDRHKRSDRDTRYIGIADRLIPVD